MVSAIVCSAAAVLLLAVVAAEKKNILVLHGYTGDADVMESHPQFGMPYLAQQWGDSYEFVYAEGPYVGWRYWEGEYEPWGKSWYHFEETTDPNAANASVEVLNAIVESRGPFYGIIGFSQGSSFIPYYLSQVPAGTFEVAMMFAGFFLPGFGIQDGLVAEINAAKPFGDIPALVWMGTQDDTIPNEYTYAQAELFTDPTILVSNAGHVLPQADDENIDEILAFLPMPSPSTTPAPSPTPTVDCVAVNHLYDNPGSITCDCVSLDNACFDNGHCVLEPSCSGDEVCEDDDEGFVFNASLQNETVTRCAEDVPGLCGMPEPAHFCCATCVEALMKCEDYDDTLAWVTDFALKECRVAVAYGFCESEGGYHMCCESCSNPTCEDHDDIVADWGYGADLDTCSEVAMYGFCDGDGDAYVRTVCCKSCSALEPAPTPPPTPAVETCKDDDDMIASWGYQGVETCSDAATAGLCIDYVRTVCCESCSAQSTIDGEEYCESGKISDEECERSICCHLYTDGGCWSSIGQKPCYDTVESPTPTPCANNDTRAIALASGAGYTISGCVEVESFCEDAAYGTVVQATCPETCGLCTPCADDDTRAIGLASGAGYMISGCVDVKSFCEHAAYGTVVQATCPVTCGSCAAPVRRLADGKDPNVHELDWIEEMIVSQVDELDQIDELTGVISPTPALAAGVRQKTEEFSNSDAKLFYP